MTDLYGGEPSVSNRAMLPSAGLEDGIGRNPASAGKSMEKPKNTLQ